jgi:glycerophosphoryl diester phosphodiesterase
MRLRLMATAAALVAAPLVTLTTPAATAATPQASQCLVAAHRGNTNVASTVATEDGMVAARRAVAAGADFLEADAEVTADDRMMLMHDATVDRTTNGTGTMISKTAAQIRALQLKDGSQVPFMTELLDYAGQTHTRVLLELKTMGGPASWDEVVTAVEKLGENQVVIQSLSTSILDKVHTLLPNVQRVLVTLKQVPPDTARTYGGVMIDYAAVTDAYLDSLAGIPVYVYLVEDATGWARFSTKVDGIVTNKPSAYITYRQGACGSSSTISSPTNHAPVADAGAPTCTGLDCSFSAANSTDPDGDPLTYSWDFGDGSAPDTSAAPTHTYADGAPRMVTLTVTDSHGLTGTATVTVDPAATASAVNHPPTAVAGSARCDALTCSFDAAGSGDQDGDSLSYTWDFGDGSPSGTGVAPSHTYAGAGTRTVTLIVDDGHGATATDTLQVTTTEPAPNQAPIAHATTPTCTGLTCSISAAGSSDPEGGQLSYDWDFGDGVHGHGQAVSHTYAAATPEVVTLTVTDPSGAVGTATVTAAPSAPVTAPVLYVGGAATNGNRTSHTVTVPATVKPGDTLLLFFTANSTAATYTGPSGWKVLQTKNGDGIAVRAFTKAATAADTGASVKVTSSVYVKSDVTVAAYRGTAASGPVAASAAKVDNTAGASHVSPAVTAVGSRSWLVTYWGDKSAATTRWTAPTGQSVRASSFGSSTGHVSALLTDSNGRVAAGASGQKTAVANAVSSRGASVSLLLAGS